MLNVNNTGTKKGSIVK